MRVKPTSAMIFAAGFGTRMGALTADRPKPMIDVAGRPLIDHALDLVLDGGVETIVVNVHYKSDMIAEHLADRAGVTVIDEQPDILETGGGLKNAIPHLGRGPVFSLNSDAIWRGPNPLAGLGAAWDAAKMDALLLLVPQSQAIGHTPGGDFSRCSNGQLRRPEDGDALIYSGLQIIKTAAVAADADDVFSLTRVWDALVDAGRAYGVVYDGQWADVGTPSGVALAEDMLDPDGHV